MYLSIYLAIINIIGFFAMFADKQKAIHNQWRIPEKTLFALALIGGSLGTTLGMHICRHKTKHWYFRFGMPLILIIQLVLLFHFTAYTK